MAGLSGGTEHGPIERLNEDYFLTVAPPIRGIEKYINATPALPLVIQVHRRIPQWDGTESRGPLLDAAYKFTMELSRLP